ncbi:glycoside hydrolase family 9 protein [Ruegeria arenilitoris]|uniref:glycoside hydrolase family 9 protein n=1 Tax=Ruegeria arenilitoris TaxID=1173585 RepID=UPI00147B67A2|nr:glycoside hydrolase family 9 protein [Ruegeria arenilitoris]
MPYSRRAFLLLGTSLVAAPIVTAILPSIAAASDFKVDISFLGNNGLQLTVVDTLFDKSTPIEVTQADRVRWSPDPTNAFGAVGKLNGTAGYFSGDVHATAPQMFTAWPQVVKKSQLAGFHVGRPESHSRAAADQPENWNIEIDGEPVGIAGLWRKSSPIRTLAVAVRQWESTKRHLVTFELDQVIPSGAVVRIKGPSFAEKEFVKNSDLRSESVHVCQAGYPLIGPKKAYVGSWFGQDTAGGSGSTDKLLTHETEWNLVSTQDYTVVRSGRLALAKPVSEPHRDGLNFNGCDIYEIDFSDLDLEGEFQIQVTGLGRSFPFIVSSAPYEEALRLAARWYFHQRSGCEITAPFGEGRTRPRNGHPEDGLTVWQTDLKLGFMRDGYGEARAPKALSENVNALGGSDTAPERSSMEPNPDAWGGWHDAGDWDRRVQHMDAVFHMADIVETFRHCQNLDLNLPESGKPFSHADVVSRKNDADMGDGETVLPDLIHEALWGASLWRRTQREDGSIIGGVEYSVSGILGSVSWNPVQKTYAYGPEEWAAYRFAYGAAKLGHVVFHFCGDTVLGRAIVSEATRAWLWAERQPTDHLSKAARGRVSQIRSASAAVVYRASGDQQARKVFEDQNPFVPQAEKPDPSLKKEVFPSAYLEYVRAGREGREVNADIAAAIEKWIRYRALKGQRMGRDYGLHNTADYPWGLGWLRFGPGSNWRAGQMAMLFALEGDATPEIHSAAIEGMWFGLGCNPANVSFVQGLGHRGFSDPLLTDQRGGEKIPGQISFGVAGGKMYDWELRKTAGAFYPTDQQVWPIYTQIFESHSIAIAAEHGIKSNAMEWLVACALATMPA